MKLINKAVEGWVYVFEKDSKSTAIFISVLIVLYTFGRVCAAFGYLGFK